MQQFDGGNPAIAEIHWVEVDGGQLYVRSWGEGPLVLFLHGWTLDWRIWLPQLRLAQKMQLVMPDRRGFGLSTAPPQLALERDDVDAIVDHFGAATFTIVGLSQGAAVALDYARARPDRLDAMALIGAPLHAVVPEPNDAPEIDRAAFAAMVRNGRFAQMLDDWRRHPLTQVSTKGQILLDQILADYDGRDQRVDQEPLAFSHSDIAALSVPLLAMAGQTDSLWRQQVAHYLGANAKNGVTEIISDAGHIANIDQPDAINALLENFIRTHHKGH